MIQRIGNWLSTCSRWIGFCAVVAMGSVIVINVVLRFTIGRPFLGTYEFAADLNGFLVAFSIAYCAERGGHVVVDLISLIRLPRTQKILDLAVAFFNLATIMLVISALIGYGVYALKTGEVSPTMHIYITPKISIIVLGFVAVALLLVVDVIKRVTLKGEKGGN